MAALMNFRLGPLGAMAWCYQLSSASSVWCTLASGWESLPPKDKQGHALGGPSLNRPTRHLCL